MSSIDGGASEFRKPMPGPHHEFWSMSVPVADSVNHRSKAVRYRNHDVVVVMLCIRIIAQHRINQRPDRRR